MEHQEEICSLFIKDFLGLPFMLTGSDEVELKRPVYKGPFREAIKFLLPFLIILKEWTRSLEES